MTTCPICSTTLPRESLLIGSGNFYFIPCPRCGPYRLTDAAADELFERYKLSETQIGTLSGFVHENPDVFIKRDDLARLVAMRPLSLPERASRILQFIAARFPELGESCEVQVSDPALQVAGWVYGERAAAYVVRDYLATVRRFLQLPYGTAVSSGKLPAIITSEGWEHLDSLSRSVSAGSDVFIAMSFNPALTFLRDDVFYPVLSSLGYRGFRVDDPATDVLIDDAIVAGIKRSRFLIADFTDQRPGVYYEAGFAAGLGLTVVRSCAESDRPNLHFDVDHYPILFWSPGDLDTFRGNLSDRIIHWVGRWCGFRKLWPQPFRKIWPLEGLR